MTHDTQAARLADKAKRLKELARTCRAWDGPHNWSVFDAAVDDALRDLAIPAGEAVAWRVSHPVSGDIFRDTEPDSGVYPPSYTVTPLYASPQPTPEASQDGNGALRSAAQAVVDRWDTPRWKGVPATGEFINNLRAALRSPLPGRESTAQAGAGEAMYLDEERDTDRRMAYNEGYQDGLFAQSKAAAPSVLAMREALQGALDLVNGRAFGKNASTATMSKRWLAWEKRAEAALASTLPEPRAGEASDDVLLRFLCDLHAHLPEADRPLGWSDFSDDQSARARKAWAAALAASPIATPTRPTLTERLQRKCSDWNTYWRAPDAHGVNLSIEQATELLADALGVEVDIATPKPQGAVSDERILELFREEFDGHTLTPELEDAARRFGHMLLQESKPQERDHG